VIVVTGAAHGQGRAEALALEAEGAVVIAADVQATADVRQLDVTDPRAWDELAGWMESEHGRVDGLINNAGITSRVRLGEVELDDWNRVLAVNVTGAMLGIQALMPLMPRGASIVNVGSVAALSGHYTAAYTASKWALRGLTHCAAVELGPRGIRVNAVHPGYIDTPMTQSAPEGFLDANVALTPLGRPGQPDDVAALMVFLMSEESSFITGADIPVDGGFSGGASAKALSDALRG
jgi:3alpha(or 20beta)-hydroxysteroid dehydrogenase